MIPIPKLDTQSFKEIYENTRRFVDRPGKIDASYQDPGETLLELFALLFDMQHFYMDFISDEHREKYAQLLGGYGAKMSYAATMMAISSIYPAKTLPQNFPFYAGNIPFETTEWIALSKNELVSLECKAGNEWHLGFSEDLSRCPVWRVYLSLDAQMERLPVPIGKWKAEYWSADSAWKSIEFFDNKIQDGFFSIRVKKAMEKKDKGLYWIRLILETDYGDYTDYIEILPKIELAKINVVKSRQVKTWCSFSDETKKSDNASIILKTYLSLHEKFEIFRPTKNGYELVSENEYEIKKEPEKGFVRCFLTNPLKECRVLYYDSAFSEKRLIATNGTPGQIIPLRIENLDEDSVQLQVAYPDGKKTYWKDWKRVNNFHASGSTDCHFVVKNGAICFGNHERGEIPPAGYIKIICCKSSLGLAGNVRKGEVCAEFAQNIVPSSGGKDKQRDPLPQVSEDMKKIYKAVTVEDYQAILGNMPVLKLGDVKIIAEDTAIKIFINPLGDKAFEFYRKNILAYLEPYRIITTQIIIEPIRYCAFSLKLLASFNHRHEKYKTMAENEKYKLMVENKLKEYFPHPGFKNGAQKKFGEKIIYGEIYKLICGIPCVKQIISLDMIYHDESKGDKTTKCIPLSPHQLAYMKNIDISVCEKKE